MGTKPVLKKSVKAKPRVAKKVVSASKSRVIKAKPKASKATKSKAKPSRTLRTPSRPASKPMARVGGKVESAAVQMASRITAVPKPPASKQFVGAVAALEAGIKQMYAEDYEKAIKSFNKVIVDFPEEAEIQASAKARIQACEKKMFERARAVYRSADDHYNIAIAMLNKRDLDSALSHLQSALKLAPKGDHILYAMAAASALKGNSDQALTYLKQSIHHRPENRFQAAQDRDFAALNEDPVFKELLSAEK